jgi:hypothetical protein
VTNPATLTVPITVDADFPGKAAAWRDRIINAENCDDAAVQKREMRAIDEELATFFWRSIVPQLTQQDA